jgi:plasmid stabilization system protein ParE
MKYRFHPFASQEADDALAYYQTLDRRLGAEFVEEFESAIARILAFPEAWQQLSRTVRRCRLNRFPYGIVYKLLDSEVLIVAVMHLHRDPNYWASRLGS